MPEEDNPCHLFGGPAELTADPPVPERQDLSRLTIRWQNGYEHYQLDESASHASRRRVYRWIYQTKVAE